MRKTKIVCTVGPATENPDMLKKLIEAGMNVVRLNTSHDDLEHHRRRIRTVKKIREELAVPITILLDLAGPKIRTGDFSSDTVVLKKGDLFTLTTEDIVGDDKRVSVSYKKLPSEVNSGDFILVNDGKIKLKVVETNETEIKTTVVNGGEITHRRGINVPGIDLGIEALTLKDKEFIKLGIEEGVDYFALSFVRKPEDVIEAKKIISSFGGSIPIISKIETVQALKRIESIAEVSDGLMVARGDLGVEIPVEEVPIAQKKIIRAGNKNRIPVITATQMLESMIENPVPTRAETTDISNAIIDGTDAVMLSAETSVGKYPIEAVSVMHKTALSTEKYIRATLSSPMDSRRCCHRRPYGRYMPRGVGYKRNIKNKAYRFVYLYRAHGNKRFRFQTTFAHSGSYPKQEYVPPPWNGLGCNTHAIRARFNDRRNGEDCQ